MNFEKQNYSLRQESILTWKYYADDHSVLYPYVKQYLVTPVGPLIPETTSPNTITVIGFMFTLIAFAAVYSSTSITKPLVILVALCNALAFYFDALDGVQGRKWMQKRRDIYVLTQLVDHGFDSITGVLNTFITGKILGLTFDQYKVLYLIINGSFLISTLMYKIDKKMIFSFTNNPTESVVFNIALILVQGFIGIPNWLIKITLNVAYLLVIANLINYAFKKMGTISQAEMIEFLGVWKHLSLVYMMDIMTGSINFHDLILFGVIVHSMTLNLLISEIYSENCTFEMYIVQIPLFLNLVLSGNSEYITKFSIIALTGYNLYLWMTSSMEICTALKMKSIFDVPPVNNNPHQK